MKEKARLTPLGSDRLPGAEEGRSESSMRLLSALLWFWHGPARQEHLAALHWLDCRGRRGGRRRTDLRLKQ